MASDILIGMQDDLNRALAKNPEERRWSMLIDVRKCVGCHGCTVACVSENKLPPGIKYRPVYETEQGVFPKVSRTFLPRPCMQCSEPACIKPCPVPNGAATWKETKGVAAGLVQINYDECIGCGRCVEACPYEARTLDEGKYYDSLGGVHPAYETATSFEYGKKRNRKDKESPMDKARKCTFCQHRLAVGMLPECVTTCIGRATYFGDLNDKSSLISQYVEANKSKIQFLKEDKKTKPNVLYVADVDLRGVYGK